MPRRLLRRLLPALLLLLAVSACSDDSSDGDGGGDAGPSEDRSWLEEDVCALLPDGVLEQVVEDPAAATPQPRTPEDIAAEKPEDVPDTFGDNQTECTWKGGSDSITLQLFDPPFPDLFTDTDGEDSITEPYEVDGGTAFAHDYSGFSCDFYLPTEPAWVTVYVTPYDGDLLDDVEPDPCAIAAEAATGTAATLGWEIADS